LATQKVDTGLPVAGFSPIGDVVTAGTGGVEQVPPGEDAIEYVWTMCLPTIVHGVTWTGSSGALRAELVEILQVRLSPRIVSPLGWRRGPGVVASWRGPGAAGFGRLFACLPLAVGGSPQEPPLSAVVQTLYLSTVSVLITVF